MPYQSFAQGGSFSPIENWSSLPGIQENQRALQQSEQQQIQDVAESGRVRAENAARNFDWMKDLAKFSETLGTVALKEQEKRNEADMATGLSRAYTEGIAQADIEAYQQGKESLQASDRDVSHAAYGLAKNGAPYEAVQAVRDLSGWEAYGYAMGKAKMAGTDYPGWIQDKLMTDTETQIPDGQGGFFTPSQVGGDPTKHAMAVAVLREKYFKDAGLLGMNPALLNEHAFPVMRKVDGMMMREVRRTHAINQSEINRERYDDELLSGGNLSDWLIRYSSTLDKEGNPVGFSGAWQAFEKLIIREADAGNYVDLDRFGSEIDPDSGKPYSERFKTRFALLKEAQAKEDRANWQDYQSDQEILFNKAEADAFAELSRPDVTDAEIQEVNRELISRFGRSSSKLQSMLTGEVSSDGRRKQELRAQLQNKASLGLLRPEDLRHLPADIVKEFQDLATQQSAVSDKELKPYLDAVAGQLENQKNVKINRAGKAAGSIQLSVLAAQNEFRRRYAQLVKSSTMSPLEAAQQASQEMIAKIDQVNATDPKTGKPLGSASSPYFIGLDGEAAQFKKPVSGAYVQSKQFQDAVNKRLKSGESLAEIIKTPGLLLSKAEAESMENSGFYTIPREIIQFAQQYGTPNRPLNPLTIANAQRAAYGLPPLKPPPSLQSTSGMTPRVRSLIERLPTPNRTARAWASTGSGPSGGQFNTAIVPMNLGGAIADEARKYGIDPAIAAAVIDWENRGVWKNRTSPAGARGVSQFMPATAAQYGVDVNNPESSVRGTVRYLADLKKMFNGNMKLAIIAYNAGPGNVQRYGGAIPGNRESQEYYQGVMRSYAKYSTGSRAALNMATRGKFRVMQYVSGDPAIAGIRSRSVIYDPAGHGGDAYHNHYEFATQAEAEQAAALFRAHGFRVTSTHRPGDPGAHGKKLAIDVAPPVNLPRNPRAEAEWSAKANRLIGYEPPI